TSGYWIEKARKRLANFKHIEFLLQKIQQANIKEGSIDCVCIHFVLHDIPKQQRKEIIGSLASKLKPGGQLAIKEPTRESHGCLQKI
ncbi:MAG: class I SAM-dependent methyltransferase, partial [Actinomycetota bacterium]